MVAAEGLTCMVRFRSPDKVERVVRLDDVRGPDLAGALPWRQFRWYRGQQHFSGFWWSSTMGDHVIYESRLQLARLILADFDPGVEAIVAQPFRLESVVDGHMRQHIPDFLLLDGGRPQVVNVKPRESLANPKIRNTLAWAHGALEQRGWATEVWSGTDPVLLANVRFLAGFRRPALFDPQLLHAAAEAAVDHGVGDTEAALSRRWPTVLVRPAILHLLWQGRLRTDLSRLLDADTILRAAR